MEINLLPKGLIVPLGRWKSDAVIINKKGLENEKFKNLTSEITYGGKNYNLKIELRDHTVSEIINQIANFYWSLFKNTDIYPGEDVSKICIEGLWLDTSTNDVIVLTTKYEC